MPRKSNKAKLNLTVEQKDNLINLSQARTAPLQEVQRSSILLKYADGLGISAIAKELNTTRVTVYKCIVKALSMGIEAALKDIYHRPYEPVITEEAKNWVISLACTKPKNQVMPPNSGHDILWLSMLNRMLWQTDIHVYKKQPKQQSIESFQPIRSGRIRSLIIAVAVIRTLIKRCEKS